MSASLAFKLHHSFRLLWLGDPWRYLARLHELTNETYNGPGIVWSSVALDWVMATSARATMWALIGNTLQGRGKFRRPLDKTCCCGVGSCLEDRFTTWHTLGSRFRLCFNSSVSALVPCVHRWLQHAVDRHQTTIGASERRGPFLVYITCCSTVEHVLTKAVG